MMMIPIAMISFRSRGAEQADDQEREDQPRDREEDVDDPHQEEVGTPLVEAGEEADQRRRRRARSPTAAKPIASEIRAPAMMRAKRVAAEVVGAHRVRPARALEAGVDRARTGSSSRGTGRRSRAGS